MHSRTSVQKLWTIQLTQKQSKHNFSWCCHLKLSHTRAVQSLLATHMKITIFRTWCWCSHWRWWKNQRWFSNGCLWDCLINSWGSSRKHLCTGFLRRRWRIKNIFSYWLYILWWNAIFDLLRPCLKFLWCSRYNCNRFQHPL